MSAESFFTEVVETYRKLLLSFGAKPSALSLREYCRSRHVAWRELETATRRRLQYTLFYFFTVNANISTNHKSIYKKSNKKSNFVRYLQVAAVCYQDVRGRGVRGKNFFLCSVCLLINAVSTIT
jgi:hypothetical protein